MCSLLSALYNVHLFFLCPAVTELLMSPGKYPNSSGTRNLHDNLSDLKAQVAANQKVTDRMNTSEVLIFIFFVSFEMKHFHLCLVEYGK